LNKRLNKKIWISSFIQPIGDKGKIHLFKCGLWSPGAGFFSIVPFNISRKILRASLSKSKDIFSINQLSSMHLKNVVFALKGSRLYKGGDPKIIIDTLCLDPY
jgi:hypothetical protein